MSGTTTGGRGAATTNRDRYGEDFYNRIGQLGGQKSRTGGFYARRDIASAAGRIGGMKGRRHPAADNKRYKKLLSEAYDHLLAIQQAAQQAREG